MSTLTVPSQEFIDNCEHKSKAFSLVDSLPTVNKELLLFLIEFLKVMYSILKAYYLVGVRNLLRYIKAWLNLFLTKMFVILVMLYVCT